MNFMKKRQKVIEMISLEELVILINNIIGKPYYDTLFSYYKTLPDWIQKEPVVISYFRLLEYYPIGLTLQQKQDQLN